jgi:hypothetical protein
MNWGTITQITLINLDKNNEDYALFFVYKKNHKKNRKLTVNAVFLQK